MLPGYTSSFPHLYTRAAAADVGRNCGSICLSLSPYCTRLIERRGNIWTEKRHHGHQQRETQISRVCRAPVCASKDVSCTHCRHMITLYRRAIQVRIMRGNGPKGYRPRHSTVTMEIFGDFSSHFQNDGPLICISQFSWQRIQRRRQRFPI